jgi:hypothetical protein
MIVSFEMVYLYQKHIIQHCSIPFIVVKMSINDTYMMFAMCEGMPPCGVSKCILYKGAVILTYIINNHNHVYFFEFWIVK